MQAPAGSGKTELLTQRFLRLLNRVTAPEQVVALTFTRKAASEMQERILLALQAAENNTSPKSPHQRLTLEYAHQALQRDRQYDWQLLKQPSRLRVMTIDSLCQFLAQAMPLQEHPAAFAQIAEEPDELYYRAARSCLQQAIQTDHLQPVISILLDHLDNNQGKLLGLLSHLLSTRDQWTGKLYQASTQTREVLEQALQEIEDHELGRFINSIPLQLREDLRKLAVQTATVEARPDSPRYPLREWTASSP